MIGRVAFLYDGTAYGGVEEFILMLLRYMDRAAFDPCVIISGYNYQFAPAKFLDAVRALDVPLFHTPEATSSRYLSTFADIRNLRRVFREQRVDIVHIHTSNPDGGRRATIAARLMRAKAVVRSEHVAPSANLRPHLRYTLRLQDFLTDRVIAGSDSNRQEQIALLGRSPRKVLRMYYGIEMTRFDPHHDSPAAKRALGLDPALPMVCSIGRLSPEKGQLYLIEAIPQILSAYGPVNFVLVGNGPLEESLKARVAELGAQDRVTFAGYQTNTVPFMQAADIAVMPSIYEGFSLAMLEFMAMGKACVFSDHPSFLEASKDGSFAVITPRKDSAAIARGVLKLLEDPASRERLGKAAAARVDDEFSIVNNVTRLMALYEELLKKRRNSGGAPS